MFGFINIKQTEIELPHVWAPLVFWFVLIVVVAVCLINVCLFGGGSAASLMTLAGMATKSTETCVEDGY